MKPTKLLDYEQEYIKVKKNNRNLAKALAEQQQLNKRYLDENTILQKKLYIASSLNMQYEKTLNDLLKSLKQSFKGCIELTNNMSTTLFLCNEGTNLQKTLDIDNEKFDQYKRSNSPGTNTHRMQAVKPMVSGHVIHHPTINLSRINEPFVNSSTAIDTPVVQNHSNSLSITNSTVNSNNNHVPISNTDVNSLTSNHLQIDNYQFDLDDETEENIQANIENQNLEVSEPEVQISRRRSLHPIIEFSDEGTPNTSIIREVRILIEPLNTDSFYMNHTPTLRQGQSKSRRFDDPLEGTSSMLDEAGQMIECSNYVPKPRTASKKVWPDNDESDSEESISDKKNKSKWVSKRKLPTEKKDITGQKYKVKKNRANDSGNSSPNDSPDSSREEINTSGNSIEESRYSNERTRRRNTPKSLAEPSLKRKLRR